MTSFYPAQGVSRSGEQGLAWESGAQGHGSGMIITGFAPHKRMHVGPAQAHVDEKQVGVGVQLHALLHLALLGALDEGRVHSEEIAPFSESS